MIRLAAFDESKQVNGLICSPMKPLHCLDACAVSFPLSQVLSWTHLDRVSTSGGKENEFVSTGGRNSRSMAFTKSKTIDTLCVSDDSSATTLCCVVQSILGKIGCCSRVAGWLET